MLVKPKTPLAESVARGVCDLFPSLFEKMETNGDPGLPAAPTPSLKPWDALIASVKSSGMTEAMQRACIAQAILESGRGTSRVSSECRNFWGMKMRPELEELAVGRSVPVTSEVEGVAVFADFKTLPFASEDSYEFFALIFVQRQYLIAEFNFDLFCGNAPTFHDEFCNNFYLFTHSSSILAFLPRLFSAASFVL
jgi:hypothetical protein